MKSRHLSLLAVAVAAVISGVAQANTVSLFNISAEWYDGSPTANVTYSTPMPSTTPQARWGTGGPQSGYDYVVASPQPIDFSVPPTPSLAQVLGTFTHLNNPITTGTSIESIKLKIIADVSVDDGTGPVLVGDNLSLQLRLRSLGDAQRRHREPRHLR